MSGSARRKSSPSLCKDVAVPQGRDTKSAATLGAANYVWLFQIENQS
jgi:hypothetical protein